LFKILLLSPTLYGFKELPSSCAHEPSLPPLSLVGVIVSNDISSSVAILRNDKTGKLKILKEGESINNLLVISIFKDRVILKKDEKIYEIFLRYNESIEAEEKSQNTADEIIVPSQEIKSLGYVFDRTETEIILRTEWPLILKETRCVPNFVDGQIKGFKITRLPRRSILSEAGVFKDDVIKEINGVELNEYTNPYQLINLIKWEDQIVVRIERGNKIRLVTYIFR
jgi:type II secretory pathway component PulC